MRLISLSLLLALITSVTTSAQKGQVNFAGSWTLNAEKSTQPEAPMGGQGGGQRMGGGNFIVTQDANLLTIERTRPGRDGQPVTTTSKYTLDGKESINTSPRGDSKSTAKWSANGKTLTIETSRTIDMNGESRTMNSTEVWTLTDAKTITILTTRQGPNGEIKATLVYDKK